MSTTSEETVTNVKKARKSVLLVNRNYTLLFVGQTISQLGDKVSGYTLVLWIIAIIAVGKPWSPLAVTGEIIAGMIPVLLVGPLAGVFVDRWQHRLTMLRMDFVRAILYLLLLAFTGIVPLPFFPGGTPPLLVQLGAIYSVAFLSNTCSQFFNPSYIGLIRQVVPREQRTQISGLSQSVGALLSIIGPALAAPLLFSAGIKWALLINMFSFIASLVTLWIIKTPKEVAAQTAERKSFRQEFLEGLHFAFNAPIIRMIIVVAIILQLGIGVFDALFYFFIQQNLHVAVEWVGFVFSALSAGTIIGAIAVSAFAKYIELKRLLYLTLLATGLVIIVFSRTTLFGVALGVAALMGVTIAAANVALQPLVMNETPEHMIGRIEAVLTPLATVASLISLSIGGYLASVVLVNFRGTFLNMTFGPIDTIYAGTGFLFIVASFYVFLTARSMQRAKAE
jgi:MFS family permease